MATPAQVTEGLCLRFAKDLGVHAQLSTEQAITMLVKAAVIATQQPFVWGFIDKPQGARHVPSGIRASLNSVQRGLYFLSFYPQKPCSQMMEFDTLSKSKSTPSACQVEKCVLCALYTKITNCFKELETHEIRYGFIPSSTDTHGWRVRRRYRLVQGGNPQLMLVHYSRGEAMGALCVH